MILSLMHLSAKVLGKFFLAMESLRYIPNEIVEMIFREYLRSISSLAIITEKDLTRIVHLLSDYHAEVFCISFRYSLVNHLNLLSAQFYLDLFKRMQNHLSHLDFSNALERFSPDEEAQLLNVIGQMESIEYLRLTHNRLDDDDIRLLTASHRITSKALCHLHSLHLQGNHLTRRSARFLKALALLDTLYVSHLSGREKSAFIKEFDNLHECTCASNSVWEEITNVGWIAEILQFHSSTNSTVDTHFYRKRRRIDHDESMSLLKLVRLCTSCRPMPSSKVTVKKGEVIDQNKVLIDPRQAIDLLSCYL